MAIKQYFQNFTGETPYKRTNRVLALGGLIALVTVLAGIISLAGDNIALAHENTWVKILRWGILPSLPSLILTFLYCYFALRLRRWILILPLLLIYPYGIEAFYFARNITGIGGIDYILSVIIANGRLLIFEINVIGCVVFLFEYFYRKLHHPS